MGNEYSQMASLAHTVIFHTDHAELDMIDRSTGQPNWFCQEAWAGGARHGRGLHQSRMWRVDGLLIASTVQDGMLRLKNPEIKGKKNFSPESMVEHLEKKAAKL